MDKREIYELVKNIDRWKHKVEVTFTEPVRIYSPKKKTRHTFAKLIVTENLLYNGQESFCFWYTPRKNSRYRYKLDEIVVEKIKNVRIIDTQKSSEFKTLESFVKRFDTRYITKKEIEGLYNGKGNKRL